jgi:sterol desaturase/sphingolipid hydroxylase (fatty acid hydroxylase superfamily)
MDALLGTIFSLFVVHGTDLREVLRLPLGYGLLIAVAFLCIHVVFPGFFRRRKIQPVGYDGRILLHELVFTASTLLLGGFIGIATVRLLERGVAAIDFGATTPLTVVLQVVTYLLAFDLYFYGLHRLIHVGVLYDWIHSVHHRSMAPNPLTAFSVHPLEALLTGGFLPLVLVLYPLHILTIAVVAAYYAVSSIVLHTGYEIVPRWWHRHAVTRWLVTPSFHDAHHAGITGNYAIYTTVWDRLFGTVREDFEQTLRAAA